MFAMLPAKRCSPRARGTSKKTGFFLLNQQLVSANRCSPGEQCGGELKIIENQ
ncbi:hypothetical protein [Marivita sp.]|uniref:hypothetical protein n=1 Tax=Marivita sp. TaxID=2003365 RepID=UPI003B5A7650